MRPRHAPSSNGRICEITTSRGKVLLPFRLRRSVKTRHLRVSVRDTGEVILSVPRSLSERDAHDFLKSQGEWIMKALGRIPRQVSLKEFVTQQSWLSLCGHKVPLELDETLHRAHWVADENLVHCRLHEARAELPAMLQEIASQYLPCRVETLSNRLDLEIERVTVRNQRTLWGSCTSGKSLSLNWRLILLPPELQDHIIYHELAHLTHLDHSANFYRLLADYDPQSQNHDHRISKLSPVIMSLGR